MKFHMACGVFMSVSSLSDFTLNSTPLGSIISSFAINHHLYADDIKIYMSLSTSNGNKSLKNLQHCKKGCVGLYDRV